MQLPLVRTSAQAKPITRQRLKTDDDLLQFKPSATRAGPSVSEAADVLREENGSRKQPDSDSVETGIPAQFARRERGTVLLRAFERRSRLFTENNRQNLTSKYAKILNPSHVCTVGRQRPSPAAPMLPLHKCSLSKSTNRTFSEGVSLLFSIYIYI